MLTICRGCIKETEFDLVLLDIEMPGVSGLDALVAIRKTYSPIQLPVIMVTARSHSEDIVNGLELGANDYITKPVDFPVALARIHTQLSHAARSRRFVRAKNVTPLLRRVPMMVFGTGV